MTNNGKKTKIILIPDSEQFGNEEECGIPFTYDMLNWPTFWADETEVDSAFETYFKNMLRAMLSLNGGKIIISFEADLEDKKLVLDLVHAEFVSTYGAILIPMNYKDNSIKQVWCYFQNKQTPLSVAAWRKLIIQKFLSKAQELQTETRELKEKIFQLNRAKETILVFTENNN